MTTDAITLAQISDLHLTSPRAIHPRQWNLKRGLGYLNWQRIRRRVHRRDVADLLAADMLAQEPDHIAVTGDLVNIGLPAEFEAASHWLATLGTPDDVSVVPGNHDIYVKVHGRNSCLDLWRSYMSPDAFGKGMCSRSSDGFPYVRRIGPLALIGLNSAEPTPPFVAAGRLGTRQLDALAEVLDRLAPTGLVRVILIHHPPLPNLAPPRRALADASAFAHILYERGAELVLHGHNHNDLISWAETRDGSTPVVGAASGSAIRMHKSEPLARYYLFKIAASRHPVSIERVVRGLDPSTGDILTLEQKKLMPNHGALTSGTNS